MVIHVGPTTAIFCVAAEHGTHLFLTGKIIFEFPEQFQSQNFYLCLFVFFKGCVSSVAFPKLLFFGLFSSVSNPLSLNLISEQQTRTCLVYDQRARNHQKRTLCLFKDKLNLIMTARQARESFHRIHKRDLCLALVQT